MINPKITTKIWEATEQFIDPREDFIHLTDDFLTLTPSHLNYQFESGEDYFSGVVIGELTDVNIFNECAEFATCMILIVPKTFRKISIQNRLSKLFWLEYEHILEHDSFIENGKPLDKPFITQVWVKRTEARDKIEPTTGDFSFVKKDGDFSIRRVGNNAGEINPKNNKNCYFIKSHVKGVKELLEKIDWTIVSHNTIGMPSISKSEIIWLYNKGIAGDLIWLENL